MAKYQVRDGLVTAVKQEPYNYTVGSSGSQPGYSGAPVFQRSDGSLLGMNVAGPDMRDFFATFKQSLNLHDLFHGSKNATHNLIISINGK